MFIKLKKCHPNARLPKQARSGDVGYDLYACEDAIIPAGRVAVLGIGLKIADYDPSLSVGNPMLGFYTQRDLTVYPKIEGRSSLGTKGVFPIAGIVDPNYRGEIGVTLANVSAVDHVVKAGDRIAQFVMYTCLTGPALSFSETDAIVETERGEQGFGSTGR